MFAQYAGIFSRSLINFIARSAATWHTIPHGLQPIVDRSPLGQSRNARLIDTLDCFAALAMNCASRQAYSVEKGALVVATAKACLNNLCAIATL
ncbi:MAG TPA: hypothetical protein VMV78_04060, partial [Thiobacillus sp.]|nr:hypothetical protein [Thiobacillus sp.]